jgi:hypothetical protein
MTLDNIVKSYVTAGLTTKVYDAPKDAVTFDKMIVIFSTPACKSIKMVMLHSSKTQGIVGKF